MNSCASVQAASTLFEALVRRACFPCLRVSALRAVYVIRAQHLELLGDWLLVIQVSTPDMSCLTNASGVNCSSAQVGYRPCHPPHASRHGSLNALHGDRVPIVLTQVSCLVRYLEAAVTGPTGAAQAAVAWAAGVTTAVKLLGTP